MNKRDTLTTSHFRVLFSLFRSLTIVLERYQLFRFFMHGKQQLVSPLECSELEPNHSPKLETMHFPELEDDAGRSFAEHCRPDSPTETEGLQTTASFS